MASIGIIYRRDLKANLVIEPPIIGEIVFALDTEEYGAIESGLLIWRKHLANTQEQVIYTLSVLPIASLNWFEKIVRVIGDATYICTANIETPIQDTDTFWVQT